MSSIMKLLFLVVLSFVVLINNGVLSASNPEHPDKCWSDETKTAYSVGESYVPNGECYKKTCSSDFTFSDQRCPEIRIKLKENCFIAKPHDLSKPHPDCCFPVVECKDE